MLSKCLDNETSAQVMVQVFSGYLVESSTPFIQPGMIGFRVLVMVDPYQDSNPFSEMPHSMGEAHRVGHQGNGAFSSVVRAKDRIPGQEGLQHRFDLPMVVHRKPLPSIPCHRDRDLLPGEPPLYGPATPFVSEACLLAPLRISETRSRGFQRGRFPFGLSNRRVRPLAEVFTERRLSY